MKTSFSSCLCLFLYINQSITWEGESLFCDTHGFFFGDREDRRYPILFDRIESSFVCWSCVYVFQSDTWMGYGGEV